jgi:predicted AAA+ superfamily ATPase
MPGLHIASAGSLIGITLSKPASFPVGKVNFMTLYPISLKEFIYASGEDLLADALSMTGADHPIPKALFDKFSDMLKYYFIVGGMPEAVAKWIESRDIEKTEVILRDILAAYELDFAKHALVKDIPKIREIWDSIPNQLARENKKFVYTAVRSGARAREYEDAVNWLKDAGLIYKIYNISKPNLPLSAYSDSASFKIYMADTGLLRVKSRLPATVFLGDDNLFTEFKGAISESFVLSEMISSGIDQPYYWTSNAAAEVEFIIQQETDIIPVEVKSGTNVRSKSLYEYRKRYNPEKAIRMSMKNIGIEKGLLSLPLFMASEIKRF